MRTLSRSLAVAGLVAALLAPAAARADEAPLPGINWSFSGLFGTIDRASAQRGFLVYNSVCANCHALKEAYYRDLSGIGLNEEQIKAIAAAKTVPALDDSGQPTERPALASDHFRSPFPNDLAARAANNGGLPPDLSVIVKAREGGADYLYGILTGYGDVPPGFHLMEGLNYNRYFPGDQIAMPPPLQDGMVEYTDGTKPTLDQEARDVVTFLAFVANPELEQRHRMGVRAVLLLLVLAGLTYAVKRKVWSDVH